MANKQTTRLRKQGRSLKFNHGVDFTGARTDARDRNPEFVIVERPSSKGRHVNSSKERNDSGRRPWQASTQKKRKN